LPQPSADAWSAAWEEAQLFLADTKLSAPVSKPWPEAQQGACFDKWISVALNPRGIQLDAYRAPDAGIVLEFDSKSAWQEFLAKVQAAKNTKTSPYWEEKRVLRLYPRDPAPGLKRGEFVVLCGRPKSRRGIGL
ncbi:MAG: hypothetical protein NTV34_14665, partial [Proteobacteria bacterium]|nr:hypothetical protein [Pseudomonadota bacterium]